MTSDINNPGKNTLQPDRRQQRYPRQPFLLTIVILIFILWMVLGWLRFSEVLSQRALIDEFFSPGTFWYLVAAGLIWGLAGLPVLLGLVIRAGWTIKLVWIAGLLYPAVYWVERLFLWKDPGAQANWPFMLVLTMIWFGILTCVSLSNSVRQFFIKPLVDEEGK